MGSFFLNLIQALFAAFWSAFWISAALVASIFSSELPFVFGRKGFGPGLIWGARAKVEVHGVPPLDPQKAYVFVMNHQSMFDVPLALAVIPLNIRFVLKKSLKYVPFIGWYAWRTKMVFVDRSNPDSAYQSIEQAVQRLRDGVSILAFPEGTRRSGPLGPFKRGPFVLAQAAGAEVVPIAAEGAGRILPPGGFKVRGGPVQVRFGAPMATHPYGNSSEEIDRLRRDVRDVMARMHRELGGDGLPDLASVDLPVTSSSGSEP